MNPQYRRLSLDVPPLMHKAIKVASSNKSETMRAYMVAAIKERLRTEKVPEFDMKKALKQIDAFEKDVFGQL